MKYCDCGCGEPAHISPVTNTALGYRKGEPRRFIAGHHGYKDNIRGYRTWTINGVVKYRHVVVAERALGKELPEGAVVHHVDGDKFNNRNSNLVICQSQSYHAILHARTRVYMAGGDPDTQAVCSGCRALKALTDFHRNSNKSTGRHDACKECRRRNTHWEAA